MCASLRQRAAFLLALARWRWTLITGLLLVTGSLTRPCAASAEHLRVVQTLVDGSGLNGVAGLAAYGTHVYAVSPVDDALVVFRRDITTGALTFVESYLLRGAAAVAVHPLGQQVFAVGTTLDQLNVYARAADGRLTQVASIFDGTNGVDGLDDPTSVAVTTDGQYVYVTGKNDNAVAIFLRDANGNLLLPSPGLVRDSTPDANNTLVDGLAAPMAIAAAAASGDVYVAGSGDNAVAFFKRSATSGTLLFQGLERNGVDDTTDPCGAVDGLNAVSTLTLSPDGQYLFAASTVDNAIAVFRRDAAGELCFAEVFRDGQAGIDGLAGVRALAVGVDSLTAPQQQFLYAGAGDDEALALFRYDTAGDAWRFVRVEERTGVDDPADAAGVVAGLSGVAALAVAPDSAGGALYAAGGRENAVAAFTRDMVTGDLAFVEAQRGGTTDLDGLHGAAGLAVSAGAGSYVYVAGRLDHSLSVFGRNPATGQLTLREVFHHLVAGVTGLARPVAVATSPDGASVYVASLDGAVVAFHHLAGGGLQFVEAEFVPANGEVTDVAVSPDGSRVYATDARNDTIVAFVRDPGTGALTPTAAILDLANTNNLSALAVGADGLSLYWTASQSASVGWHTPAGDGSFSNGAPGIDGLAGARSLVLSDDGLTVYVAGEAGDAVAAFARFPDGTLTQQVDIERDGVGGVDGLGGVQDVAANPDGVHVYAAGSLDASVAVFRRSGLGELSFVSSVRPVDGNGTPILDGARAVVASPDGQQVYAAGETSDSLVVFDVVRCGDGVREGSEACDDAGMCVGGDNAGAACATAADCLGGHCTRVTGQGVCTGGSTPGTPCTSDAGCSGGVCVPANGDGCDTNCTVTACGNGITTGSETCDDGDLDSGDGCDANCTATGCGNGIVTAGEACDDGNQIDTDMCRNSCQVATCGDGVPCLAPDCTTGRGGSIEECDDGDPTNGDECDNNCTTPRCGNGAVAPGEQCDDGNNDNSDACIITNPGGPVVLTGPGASRNCADAQCGDGLICVGAGCTTGPGGQAEQCEPRNGDLTDPDDNCSSACGVECGNGTLDGACTAGAKGAPCAVDTDCDTAPGAGNGRCRREACDDGPNNCGAASRCDDACTNRRCGNALQECDEQCDFGDALNSTIGSGCSAGCRTQRTNCRQRLGLWAGASVDRSKSTRRRNFVVRDDDPVADLDCADGKCDPGQCTFAVDLCVGLQAFNAGCNPASILSVDFTGLDTTRCWEGDVARRLTTGLGAVAQEAGVQISAPRRCSGGTVGKFCTADDDCDRFLGDIQGACDTATGALFSPTLSVTGG